MNRVFEMLKKYMFFIMVLTGVSIVLGMSYSNFKVTSENHKVAEMYIGTLKYSMTIDGTTANTLSVPSGETIIDVTITNENPIDTYYKLIYENNSNITITYYEGYSLDDSNNISNSYDSPNDKLLNSETNNLKLKVVNNSTSAQTVTFKVTGGYVTNTLDDVKVPTGYSIIEKDTSTNTYFCTTADTLTSALKYINGQYTYAYKQEGKYLSSGLGWGNIDNNGWGVSLTDKSSTEPVTSKGCTYINNKPLTSMSYMFYHSKATSLDLSSFDTSNVTNMSDMFSSSQATTIKGLENFNTSKVTDMSSMFHSIKLTTLDVNNFDTSKVTDMNNMFHGSQVATLDLSNFDTSNVTCMTSMFVFNQATTINVSSFNTSNVTDMTNMFGRSQATTINGLENFDTSKVTSMFSMFAYSQVTTLDLSNFDTSKVTDMSTMFSNNTNLKTIYVSNKFNTDKVTSSSAMFSNCTSLVGGAGTTYNSSYVDKTYAHIDGGTSNPGYFTDVADKPKEPESFAEDSWKTIANAIKNGNTGKYNVGDTKTIDMGTYGTHTLRIANTSTPSECNTEGFSQTACGFVLEFADIITTHNMNPSGTYNGTSYSYGWNKDGWPASSMYTFVNNDIYNALPSDLKSAIIDTTVVSSHGSEDTANFTSTDKLYLLAPKEIYKNWSDSYDTAKDLTRTLDYYVSQGVTTENLSGAIKNNGSTAEYWYLRTAYSSRSISFYIVISSGAYANSYASNVLGVSPAFRIG